jgi:cyanate permease
MLYGINWTAWGLAGAAGPIVMGRAFDATGSYSVVLFGLGAMTLVAAGLMLTLPPVLRREESLHLSAAVLEGNKGTET